MFSLCFTIVKIISLFLIQHFGANRKVIEFDMFLFECPVSCFHMKSIVCFVQTVNSQLMTFSGLILNFLTN